MSQFACNMHEIECQTKACADPINDYLFFGGVEWIFCSPGGTLGVRGFKTYYFFSIITIGR